MKPILVWDWPVRVGHWLMVAAFALAWLTAESETFRLLHTIAGGVLVGVILFRLFWGVVGTRYAQFGDFVRGPAEVATYLLGLMRGCPPHTVGHNPAGGWAIVALLALGLLTGASGWLTYQEIGGKWGEKLHEMFANIMLIVVSLHVGGVVVGSIAHRENLVRAMFSGYKRGVPSAAIASARGWAVLVLMAFAGMGGYWLSR